MTETLKLTRNDNQPWGFRLSGGKDFGVILYVQKVNPGSLAAQTGMQSGDSVVAINGQDTGELRHKEAQDAVLKAGNNLEIAIQRGANNWKPAIRSDSQGAPASAAGEKVTSIGNQQQNTTAAMYSMHSINETLSAHAEMIAPGVMGINFMKPEKAVNTMSEVYRLVQEEEQNKAKSPTPPKGVMTSSMMAPRRAAPPVKTPPPVPPKPAAPASPAVNTSPFASMLPQKAPPVPPPQSQGTCTDCGRFIVGPFVRLNDRILHEECFKCSTCGSTLKNVGYVNINNKLYCDMHAKLAAKVIAPETESAPPPQMNAELPSSFPQVPPLPQSTMAPQPLPVAAAPSGPTPFSPHLAQNLVNLPQTPSSSGGLTFRSISPQPFKRISGDYHRVTAPMSPTSSPMAAPTFLHDSTGPLPFEMKPYMPQEQQIQSSYSSSSTSQVTQISQTTQQSSTVSQSSSQFQVDYKQMVGQQRTRFVWPPPKPEDMMKERAAEDSASAPPQAQQHYSPLATQSTPPQATTQYPSTTFRSVQPPVPMTEQPKPQVPPPFVPPPLPSTFSKPPELEMTMMTSESTEIKTEAPVPTQAPAPTPAPLPISSNAPLPRSSNAPGFAPVLAPVADADSKKDGLGGVPQAGVPTGAGSRPAPKRGKGQLKEPTSGGRIPICADCGAPIRGPFVIALGKTWCPDHFHCNNLHCKRPLQDVGFVEEQGQLYCETCYEAFLAPICNKCGSRIKGDCLNALDKPWHPDCFLCSYCHKPFGNSSFYLEDGLPYCEKDWNELFTTKCVGCGYPIEAGDRWVEALNNNYHSQCFKCSICNKNLEGQSFYAKGGKPFCKAHAR